MSREETQEDLFNRLLNDLEKTPKDFIISFAKAVKAPANTSSSYLAGLQVHVEIEGVGQGQEMTGGSDLESLKADLRAAMIKVMNSGIFYKGGLQGRPLKRNNLDYKVYFFNDLALFILKATDYLLNKEEELDRRFCDLISKTSDNAINIIYKLKSIATVCRSKINMNKLENIRKDLEDIKSNLLTRSEIDLPAPLKKMPDRIDLLISLFKEQLPSDTPVKIIPPAISTLLHSFNIFTVEPEAIYQRMKRAKQK